jgi:rRNA maturation RNase YbeY
MAIWFRTHLRSLSVRPTTIRRVAQSVLEQAGHPTAQLSLSLVGKTRMRSLNRKYRGRDYPTDVLAFPMGGAKNQTEVFLGDVVICLPIALEQSSRFENTPNQEILRLLIHGTLHLLGYDHEQTKQEATRMQKKEKAIFKKLLPIPRLLA